VLLLLRQFSVWFNVFYITGFLLTLCTV